jgi:hypothetical protein
VQYTNIDAQLVTLEVVVNTGAFTNDGHLVNIFVVVVKRVVVVRFPTVVRAGQSEYIYDVFVILFIVYAGALESALLS